MSWSSWARTAARRRVWGCDVARVVRDSGPAGHQGDWSGLWEPVALWQRKTVRAPSLSYEIRVAKPRALGCPGGGWGLWSRVFPVPADDVCLRQETALSVLETPPEHPWPLAHVLGQEERGMNGVGCAPSPPGFLALGHLPICACWMGKVCQGPYGLSPGGHRSGRLDKSLQPCSSPVPPASGEVSS